MSSLPLNKECWSALMFVLTFYQDIYLSFLFLFRFCYFADQVLVDLKLRLWVSNTSSILYNFFSESLVDVN